MKISRLMAMTILGLGLISQQTFPYGKDVKKHGVKPTTQTCKQECRRSIFPLFNKKENKRMLCECKDMKHSKKTTTKVHHYKPVNGKVVKK